MPPRELSRHTFTRVYTDEVGATVLDRAEPFRFVRLSDNIQHVVGRGDTLFTLAGRYYGAIDPDRASGLWWVIADFQPDPIHDPTIKLAEGRVMVIPSVRTVIERVFDERRRITGE
jgi:hypothetical protein